MKKSMVCGLVFLFAVGLVGVFLAGESYAQIRPAYTASIDEPGRTPYKASVRQYCFLVNIECDFSFPAVPAGKRLVVEHISGYFSSRQAGSTQFLFVSTRRGGEDVSFLPTNYQGPGFGAHIFVFNGSVREYYGAGETPIVRIATGDRGYPIMGAPADSPLPDFNIVTLSGYLIDCVGAPCQPIAP